MATLKELRETAKAYGIKGRSKMSSYELEKAIREHEQAEKETQLVSQLETAHINYFITGKTYIMKSIDGNFSFPFEVTTRNALNEITIAFDNYRIEENNSFVKTGCYSIERAEVKIIDGIEYISYPHVYNRKTGEYMTFKAQTAEAPASTPVPVKINPDLAPDFDAAFDECAYSPDYQTNRAVLDDEPQPRRLVIRRRPAPAGRKLPTPKSHRKVYDFSKCTDAETLRKALNAGSIDVIKVIAESYREFQPRTDGKAMTKTDYVTAIVRLYFPDYQPAPAKKLNTPTAEEIAQVRNLLLEGKYGISFFDGMTRDKATAYLYHYSCWNGYYSLKELHLITKALNIKILPTRESMIYVLLNWMEDRGIISPDTDINPELKPDYDASFDETAYTPERQDNLAVLDDIPADHESDVQKVKITPVQEAKPETTEQPREPWQEHTCDHCNGKPNWTHEQFIRGILLSYERTEVNSKVSEYLPMSRYLTQKYSLAQLHNLAKFFGLNVPAIELTSENKTGQKAYQIANIIADEIGNIEHVYACTYITTGAPDLPAELAEHAPEWEKETIARAQAMPVSVEPEHQQKKHCPLLSLSYWDRHTKSHNEKCRKNRKFIDTLQTVEEITAIMLDFGMKNIFEQAIYDRVHLNGQYLFETDEETTARYAETYAQKIIARRQRKTKTKTRKNAPKPATKKPRHTKKFDDSRQILIQFDEPENTPAPVSTPAKPKTRRTRAPRVKRDYSRQILIDFGENIPDSQNNQRIAA